MLISKLAADFERLSIKLAQDTTAAQKTHYLQIINLNKAANDLENIVAKSQYTDQIKQYVKNLTNMVGALATKAYNQGVTKIDSTQSHGTMMGILNNLKTLIHTNTFKPFDDVVKALEVWTPIDLPIQNPNAPKPQQTNPANTSQNTPTPITTPTSIPTQAPTSIPGI